jgi:outer membrane protein assembly factor BamB
MRNIRILIYMLVFAVFLGAQNHYTLINSTFLGSEERNYYGNKAPDDLDIIWKVYLGEGVTRVGSRERIWRGSGWTGQTLMYRDAEGYWLIHGSLDHHLRKINAKTGEIVWEYAFPDAIKGTGTLWKYRQDHIEKLLIIQGSRRDTRYNTWYRENYPLRAVDADSGKELWRYPVRRGASYSVDVDASALIVDDRVFIGLENGYGVIFDPLPGHATEERDFRIPRTEEKFALYEDNDRHRQGYNLVTESSPSRLKDHVYFVAGSGHVYGYNLNTERIDWDFFVGSDMDGSPVVTADECLLISVEKEYNTGQGGVFKLDPSKPADSSCVRWFFPTGNDTSTGALWAGGVIGSPAVNDVTRSPRTPPLAAFTGIDGYVYVVRHDRCDSQKTPGPNQQHIYPMPKLVAKRWAGQSIATPVFAGDKLIVAGYSGISLFQIEQDLKLTRLERRYIGDLESTPFVFDKRIYIGSKNGYLYCLGDKAAK